MKNVLNLVDHFSSEELYQRYRKAEDPVEKTHWQLIWLKSQGKQTKELCSVTGYSRNWVHTLIHRYNRDGANGLRDQRHEHPGAPAMLSDAQQAELARQLESGKAPDGGLWNGPKVARYIETQTGRAHVHDQRGWDYLLKLGFTAQTPRRRHASADAAEQAAFKK